MQQQNWNHSSTISDTQQKNTVSEDPHVMEEGKNIQDFTEGALLWIMLQMSEIFLGMLQWSPGHVIPIQDCNGLGYIFVCQPQTCLALHESVLKVRGIIRR